MRTLVLGGSVFVGRRLVQRLHAAGHEVAVLNRGVTAVEFPEGVERVVADRTDAAAMRAALGGRDWDAVYDVSGFVMAAGGADIEGLLELLDGHTGAYVFVSSIMAYDQAQAGWFPWTEDLPTNTDGPTSYGGFKAISEASMLERNARTGFPSVIVRPAAIYGPDNNIYDMETPMFLRLLQHRPILLPNGGLVAASYGHVDDLCDAMIHLASTPAAHGQVLNITGNAPTTRRYIEELAAIVGEQPDVVELPADSWIDAGRVFGHLFNVRHHAVLDTAKATALGVVPSYTFRSGHQATYDWFCEQGYATLTEPLIDRTWNATWDFEAEAALAARIRGEA